jgi:hypothetical protein
MATHTLTLDVAGLKYIDKDRIEHTINTNETLTLTFTDEGTGGLFVGLIGGGLIGCTDGFQFTPECDPAFGFRSSADGSTTLNNGNFCFVEEGNVRHHFRVSSLNMTNADGVGANNIVSITFESLIHGLTMTWTNINTA